MLYSIKNIPLFVEIVVVNRSRNSSYTSALCVAYTISHIYYISKGKNKKNNIYIIINNIIDI